LRLCIPRGPRPLRQPSAPFTIGNSVLKKVDDPAIWPWFLLARGLLEPSPLVVGWLRKAVCLVWVLSSEQDPPSARTRPRHFSTRETGNEPLYHGLRACQPGSVASVAILSTISRRRDIGITDGFAGDDAALDITRGFRGRIFGATVLRSSAFHSRPIQRRAIVVIRQRP